VSFRLDRICGGVARAAFRLSFAAFAAVTSAPVRWRVGDEPGCRRCARWQSFFPSCAASVLDIFDPKTRITHRRCR